MGFTDEVRQRTDPLHQQIFRHPFVVGIGNGSLDVEAFKFYIRQDYLFLIQYSRVLALAVAKAPDLDSMGRFAQLLHETLNTEMALHRSYCTRFSIGEEELEATEPAPTTVAYTTFLLDTAHRGSFSQAVMTLLPCQWGYCEIGERLAAQGEPANAPLYAEWIRMYSSTEFRALADWARALADRLAESASPTERQRMEEAYVTSTRYEYLFWDMAYSREQWPL